MAQVVHKVSPAVVRERIHASPEQIAAFCRARHIRWLALFGSVLRDDFRDDSDIDVLYALEPGKKIDHFPAAEALSRLLGGHEADFIRIENLKWRIRDRVYADTETLYGDPPEEVIHARAIRSLHSDSTVKDENLYIGDMLDKARQTQRIVSGRTRDMYDSDELFQLAVLHLVQTIGEAATHVSRTTRDLHPGIPWSEVIG
ncbi:MAG: HepT-like ribonuclease domain-containing protein, partial [Thermomicrobiales bacterium]